MTKDKIIKLLQVGFTVEAIMKELGVSWSAVGVVARELNYQHRTVYKSWSDIENEDENIRNF